MERYDAGWGYCSTCDLYGVKKVSSYLDRLADARIYDTTNEATLSFLRVRAYTEYSLIYRLYSSSKMFVSENPSLNRCHTNGSGRSPRKSLEDQHGVGSKNVMRGHNVRIPCRTTEAGENLWRADRTIKEKDKVGYIILYKRKF